MIFGIYTEVDDMKKIFSALLACALLVTICGCGGKSADPTGALTLTWDGYSLSYDGNPLSISEHKGSVVSIGPEVGTGGLSYNVMLDSSKDVTNITVNTQGILEENMEKLKDMFYYSEYLGSRATGAMPLGNEYWAVCQCSTQDTPMSLVAQNMLDYVTTIPLTDKVLYVNCGDKFTFGNEWYETIARPGKCLIKDVIQVLPGQVLDNMEPYTFYAEDGSTRSGSFGETASYDYYYYEGFTIQCAKGVTVTEYVKFK